MKICAVIGSKKLDAFSKSREDVGSCLALKVLLYRRLESLVEQEAVTGFVCGMAVGAEMLASEVILELKEKYPHISLESTIPYETLASGWNEKLRDRYFNIAACCDKETLLQKHYSPDCFIRQDLYMIGKADIVVSAWAPRSRRLARELGAAEKLGKKVIDITFQ